jgi:hypothetical protein
MIDSEDRQHEDDLPVKGPLPENEKFFDPWEEEFRKSYARDDKAFDF